MHIGNFTYYCVQHNEYIFCISFILFFHPCHLYVIDYAKCPSPGTENSERNSLFSILQTLISATKEKKEH